MQFRARHSLYTLFACGTSYTPPFRIGCAPVLSGEVARFRRSLDEDYLFEGSHN